MRREKENSKIDQGWNTLSLATEREWVAREKTPCLWTQLGGKLFPGTFTKQASTTVYPSEMVLWKLVGEWLLTSFSLEKRGQFLLSGPSPLMLHHFCYLLFCPFTSAPPTWSWQTHLFKTENTAIMAHSSHKLILNTSLPRQKTRKDRQCSWR